MFNKKICFGCGKEFYFLASPMRCEECLNNKVKIQSNTVKDSYFKIDIKYPFFFWDSWTPTPITETYIRKSYGLWFRFWGWGLHFTNAEKTFSERNAYKKFLPLPFVWRVKILYRD